MGIFDRIVGKKSKAHKEPDRERSRSACIEEIMKAKGLTEDEAIKSLKETRTMLGISYDDYLKHGFAGLGPEEQRKKYKKLISRAGLEGKKQILEEAVFRTVDATGMTYKDAKEDIRGAKEKYGITYKEYFIDRFYNVPGEERESYAAKILQEREYDVIREEEKKEKTEKQTSEYIDRVVKETGWDRDLVKEKMRIAKELTGVTKENYAIFRFWELTEEEQKTYFTRGYNQEIIKKYSKAELSTRRMMFYKDLFYDDLKEYLGRKYLVTACMDWDEFKETFGDEKKIVYKPRAGVGGKGVTVYESRNEEDLRRIYDEICTLPFGVVETYLIQHPEMQKFSARSVNTIRLVTIRTNDPSKNIETGKVHFVYGGVRMSTLEDSYVDNLHSGGAIAAVDVDDGTIITGAANHLNQLYDVHPVTGAQILGAKLPYFEESKRMIERVMVEEDIEGYYGWDVAVTADGPVLVEGNNNPGSDGLQIPWVPYRKGMRYVFDEYMK